MNKIFGGLCVMVIGLLYGGVLVTIYLIGLLYLLLNEIIGTKKFMNKFKKLNGIVITEIKDIIKIFRTLYIIKYDFDLK